MKMISCYRVGSMLSQGVDRLSPGQRLQIELHRDSCDRCRADDRFDRSLRKLADAATPELSQRSIDGAIARALAAPVPARPVSGRRVRVGLIGGGLLAAAAALTVWFATRDSAPSDATAAQDEPSSAPTQPESAPDVVDNGEIAVAQNESRTFAHAQVRATVAAVVRWNAEDRRLSLQSGAARVRVTPGTGKSFTVETTHFVVSVVGTEFDVDGDTVTVYRGVVLVSTADGLVVDRRVQSGETWSRTEPDDQAEPPEPIEETAAIWLRRANRHIRDKRSAAAKRAVRKALAASPTGREKAEAYTLRAELDLLSGDRAAAATQYRRIAERFRRYPQGESALFAAARLEGQRGRAAVARTLLERYRERYPKGRFIRQVRHKLETLDRQ